MTDPFDTYFPNFDADEWEPRVGRGGYRYEVNRRTGARRPAKKLPGALPGLGFEKTPDTSVGAVVKEMVKTAVVSAGQGLASAPKQAEAAFGLPGLLLKKAVDPKRPLAPENIKKRVEEKGLRGTAVDALGAVMGEAKATSKGDLGRLSDEMDRRYEEQVGRLADATATLPTPLAAGLYGLAETAGMALDPTNVALGGEASRISRLGLDEVAQAAPTPAQAGKALPGPVARPVAPVAEREIREALEAGVEPVWPGYGTDLDGTHFALWLDRRGIDPVDAERTGDIHRLRDEFFEEANPDPDVLPLPTEVVAYRGVGPGRSATDTAGAHGEALFFAADRKAAAGYAGQAGTVTEARLSFRNLLDAPDWMAAKGRLGLPRSASMEDLIAKARRQGHDGLSFTTTNGKEYITLSPGAVTPRGKAPIEVNLFGRKFTIDDPEAGMVKLDSPDPPVDPATAAFRAQVFDDGPATPPLRERLGRLKERIVREFVEEYEPMLERFGRVGDRRTGEILAKEARAVGHTALLPVEKGTRRWNRLTRDWEDTGAPLTAVTDALPPEDLARVEAIAVAQSQVEYAANVAARNVGIAEQRAARAVELRDYRRARVQARRKISEVADANAVELPGLKSRQPLPRPGKVDAEMTAQAQSYLGEMAASGDLERLAPHLDAYRDWSARAQVEPLVGVGVLTREQADQILASNQRYAIFQEVEARLQDMGVELGRDGEEALPRHLRSAPRGGVTSQRQSPLRQRKEGLVAGRKIVPTFEAAAVQAARIERFATRQIVKNELAELVALHPQSFPEIRPAVRKVHGKDVPDLEARGSFITWKDGKRVAHQAPDDLLEVIDHIRPQQASLVWDVARSAASTLRTLATLAPHFPGMNFLRDQPTAAVYSRHGMLPYYDAGRVLAQRLMNNLGLEGLADRELMQAWDDFTKSAAGQSTFLGADREGMRETLRRSRERATPAGRRRERIRSLLNPLYLPRELGNALESATRVAEWDLARRGGRETVAGLPTPGTKGRGHAGLGKTEAMRDAADVSLDFLRGGKATKKYNQIDAFLNVRFLDTSRFFREMRERPFTIAARGVAFVTLPALAEEWFHRDDEDYQNLPLWDKALFYHVNKIDDGWARDWYVRLPRPLGLLNLVFGYLPQLALREGLHGEEAETAREAVGAFLDETPAGLLFQQDDGGEVGFSTDLVPTIAKGPTELWANRNWKGSRIYDPELPAEEQYDEHTSGLPKALARGIDWATPEALRPMVPEALRSPDQLEHLALAQTAGTGRAALDLPGMIFEGASDPGRVPVVRSFLSPPPFGFSSQPYREAQGAIEKAEGAYRAWKRALETGETEAADLILARYPEAALFTVEGPAWDLATERRRWGELRDLREQVAADAGLSEEERRAELLEIDMGLSQQAAEVLRILREERAKRGAPAPQAPPAGKPDPFDQYFPNFE